MSTGRGFSDPGQVEISLLWVRVGPGPVQLGGAKSDGSTKDSWQLWPTSQDGLFLQARRGS